ncbi:MAG: endolytic transglycosylase MltG, partial [Acidobacteria bacterium]|nr:endolytic transglycosylase MltG [Acidobacteriota bacterium]
SLEGLLFPDTYQVSNGETEAQLVQRMVALMERVADQEDIDAKSKELGFSPYQVLVIASLIEREAGVEEDRAKIARVIYNRLYLQMPLQIDASLYYQQDASRPFSELRRLDTPYNTYMYAGLPPTPIANPGRASIQAALNPAANPSIGDPICVDLPKKQPCLYLYYVLADKDGRHVFAATAEQHEENVRKAREAGLL